MRIVIIDDSAQCRSEVRRLLVAGSARQYTFVEADDGARGLEIVCDSTLPPPDCVVLDHWLPDATALDVLAALMDESGTARVPVVVVTGEDDPSAEIGASVLRAGAQDYIGKSWLSAPGLTRAVENALERHRMQRELHERQLRLHDSEERLRLALSASHTGIWTWDVRSNATTWTEECYAIMDVPREGFDGTADAFFDRVLVDDRARVEEALARAVADGGMYHAEFRIVLRDGSKRWVQNVGRAAYDQAGQPVSVLGTLSDIDQRRRAQDALQVRERQLRTLAENSPNLIARFDRELRHVYLNAAIEPITKRSAAEFIGKTNRELGMPEPQCSQWDEAMRDVFTTGRASTLYFEFAGPEQLYQFENKLVPELGASGEVESLLVVGHDITALKRASAAVARSEEVLRRAQRAARVGTFDWSLSSGETSWTEEAWHLFGLPPFSRPLTHELWLACVHPDDRDRVASEMLRALQRGTPYVSEYRVVHPTGLVRSIETYGEVVHDAGGQPERLVGTLRDVSLQRDTERKLREAVLARERLLSLVSHDMRTPLSAILHGHVNLRATLRDEVGERARERVESTFQRLARQTTRLEQLIDELLDAAKGRGDEALELDRSEVDLTELARAVVEDHQRAARKHEIVLRGGEPLRGIWDGRRIERVLANLLSNALKYSPAGGRVDVELTRRAHANGAWAVVEVRDRGMGIPAADLPHVFEWFRRASNTRDTHIPGTGIGLAGSREIVVQHGGSIRASSTEGVGSTFIVELPM